MLKLMNSTGQMIFYILNNIRAFSFLVEFLQEKSNIITSQLSKVKWFDSKLLLLLIEINSF